MQNIAEGSQASATSKKMELKEIHAGRDGQSGRNGRNGQGAAAVSTGSMSSMSSTKSTKPSYPEIVANAALILITVACSLLDRQLAAQAKSFEQEGGFSERLYKVRSAKRKA